MDSSWDRPFSQVKHQKQISSRNEDELQNQLKMKNRKVAIIWQKNNKKQSSENRFILGEEATMMKRVEHQLTFLYFLFATYPGVNFISNICEYPEENSNKKNFSELKWKLFPKCLDWANVSS